MVKVTIISKWKLNFYWSIFEIVIELIYSATDYKVKQREFK